MCAVTFSGAEQEPSPRGQGIVENSCISCIGRVLKTTVYKTKFYKVYLNMNPDILVSFTEAILRRTMFYKTFLQGYAHTRQVQKLRRSTIKVVFPMYYECT